MMGSSRRFSVLVCVLVLSACSGSSGGDSGPTESGDTGNAGNNGGGGNSGGSTAGTQGANGTTSGSTSSGDATAGVSGGTTASSGSTGSSGSGGTSGGAGASSGSVTTGATGMMQDAGSQTSDGGNRDGDGGSGGNVGMTTTDGGSSDGPLGAEPFKGVANSACADLTTLKVSWWYNWTLSPSNCNTAEFVPMIWGHTGKEQTADGIKSEIAQVTSGGYKTVLGFNEPDNTGQSNMSVDQAIALWPSFNDPAVRIGSPATQANTTGIAWFKDFMGRVNADTTGALRVDFLAIHWYGWNQGSCDAKASTLESYIKQIEAIPGSRPIWITEWGCLNMSNPDMATVQAFFDAAIGMFARHPRVERYAWYPWTTNNELVATGGGLTSLGIDFAKAPSTK